MSFNENTAGVSLFCNCIGGKAFLKWKFEPIDINSTCGSTWINSRLSRQFSYSIPECSFGKKKCSELRLKLVSGVTVLNSGLYTCYAYKSEYDYDHDIKAVSKSRVNIKVVTVSVDKNLKNHAVDLGCDGINHIRWSMISIFILIIITTGGSYFYARQEGNILKQIKEVGTTGGDSIDEHIENSE